MMQVKDVLVYFSESTESRKYLIIDDLLDMEVPEAQRVARILMGAEDSDLLTEVYPGSVPDAMGAKHTLTICLRKFPKGGINLVIGWVRALELMMNGGWGVALTQPGIFQAETSEGLLNQFVLSPINRIENNKIVAGLNGLEGDVLVFEIII